MRKPLLKFSFIFAIFCLLGSTTMLAAGGDGRQKTIRLFMHTGETVDIDAAQIDSITTTKAVQNFWLAATCRTIPLADIDSIWYMTPTLRITTEALDFGRVAVGNTKTLTATLTNTGDYKESYSMYADGGFSVTGAGRDIALLGGQSMSVELTFVPTDSIGYAGQLYVASGSAQDGMISMPIVGTGVATVADEANAYEEPVERAFDIVIPEDETVESFEGFKIVNFNGEFPVDVPAMARSMRRARRADGDYMMCSASAATSLTNLQFHSFTDALNNPYMFTISQPGQVPEISYASTALALLMMSPLFSTSDEAEYKNTVAAIKKTNAFRDLVADVVLEYNQAKRHNRSPDYSQINPEGVIRELYNTYNDTRELTLDGVSLKDLTVTPRSASFKLRNDIKRTIHMYPSRVKMNERNLVVMEQEDLAPVFSELLEKFLDKLELKLDEIVDISAEELKKKEEPLGISLLDAEDIEFIKDVIRMLRKIETEEMMNFSVVDPRTKETVPMSTLVKFRLPYVMESVQMKYQDILGDGFDYYYFGTEKSPFEKVSNTIEYQFDDFDRILLDVYGIGIARDKSLDQYSEQEQARIAFALMWGAYFDIVKPMLELRKAVNGFNKAAKFNFTLDLNYGLDKSPEFALVAKLTKNFAKDPNNWIELKNNLEKGGWKGVGDALCQVGMFVLNELISLPSLKSKDEKEKEKENGEEKKDDERPTYLDLFYQICKKWGGNKVTSEDFIKNFEDNATTFLGYLSVSIKTMKVYAKIVDVVGGLKALAQSDIKQTAVINKYDEPFIEVIEPTMEYFDPNVNVHFEWKLYNANLYGNFSYTLELRTESLSGVEQTVVLPDIEGTSCDYNIALLPGAKSAQKIFFRIIAHGLNNPSQIYVQTDFIELVHSSTAAKMAPPEMVDLGLPSGTKWAVYNLGAKSAKDPGNYYSWGEVTGFSEGKTSYTWGKYKWYDTKTGKLTKYCTRTSYGKVDNLTQLEPAEDKVKTDYGYYFSVPTKADWEELMKYGTWSRFGNDIRVMGPNGAIILLPACGYRDGLNLYDGGTDGYYWSSTLDDQSPDDAWYVHCNGPVRDMYSYYRYKGMCIRPVQHKPVYSAPSTANQ
ncbi:MAG: hypothetical protein IJ637_00160 [Prevotella sp.]|nr:hypothetical protein [Prevotella sp.]